MGLKNYFKAGKGDAEKKPEAPANEMSEISGSVTVVVRLRVFF
jgi:hypothetical protein